MEWAWNMLRKCLDDNKYPLAQPGGIYVCSTVKGGAADSEGGCRAYGRFYQNTENKLCKGNREIRRNS